MTDFDFGDFNDVADMAGVFQRAQQQRTQQQTLEALEGIREEFARQNAMPQCPICGGRLGGHAVQKCMHCQVEIEWISGRPYDPQGAIEARKRLARQLQEQEERQKLAMKLLQKAIPVMERAIEEFLLADAQEVSSLEIQETRSGHSVEFTRPVESQHEVVLTIAAGTFAAGRAVLTASGIQHRVVVLEITDINRLIGPIVTIFGAAGIEAPIDFSVQIKRPQPKVGCLGMLFIPILWSVWAS